jgi:predicted dehydrogenase/threonine dehydrogenase-like Zn-dependent dehydrogenase
LRSHVANAALFDQHFGQKTVKQISQKLGSGSMKVLEVPLPCPAPNSVVVRNHYSLISAGTESSTVKAAREGYLGKILDRPQQVKQAIDVLRSQGPVQSYRAVMKKLDAYSPLGYSCAGEVIGIGPGTKGIAVGDWAACGGLNASHAEIVSVPENLCVTLKPDADLRQAAYNTLGAVAMQGVRQAGLQLGESCAVIGLGLLGQLAGLLLRAAGVRTVGIDIDPRIVEVAQANCVDAAFTRNTAGIEDRIARFSGGLGCDAVIITAAADSLDPINFAGAIARKRGTIVVVGDVPTGFDREPHFYRKELQVRMSCSYGPGRYDPMYEEKGIDYPPAYVRWTEKRNMEAFQELIYAKRINVNYLTTHVFRLEDAPRAYDMMMAKSEPFIGILVEYDAAKELEAGSSSISIRPAGLSASKASSISIGFIGAGSYAQSHLLPNIDKRGPIGLKAVLTSRGTSSRSVAERFGFEFCTSDEADIFDNPDINTVFVATRHDSHGQYVLKALKAGKHVFVEKPLCLSEDELQKIVVATDPSSLWRASPRQAPHGQARTEMETVEGIASSEALLQPQTSNPLLMVGYNRRFSPFARIIKEQFAGGPMAMSYRINAGKIAPDSWIQDFDSGGGRIIGEVCHFVDFLTYVNGSLPLSVFAAAMEDPSHLNDTVNVSLQFENGSIGTISYFANGNRRLPKERVEIFAHGCAAVIDDFQRLTIFAGGKKREKKLLNQDKGQKQEIKAFIEALLKGHQHPIALEEIFSTSLATFRILESLRTGQQIRLGSGKPSRDESAPEAQR